MVFQGDYPITEKELYHYNKPGKLYPREKELLRSARQAFEKGGPDPSWFLPVKAEKTAFLVVDIQNDMVRPDAPMFCPDGHRMIPRVKKVIDRCRDVGIKIVYIEHCHDPRVGGKYWDIGHRRYFPTLVDYFIKRKREMYGTEGPKTFLAIAPMSNEKVVFKHRWDGFIGTDLDETLRGMGVDTLIFSGVFAEFCVESTARHAAELEYKVIYVSDLVASYAPEQHKTCLERIRFAFGMVMSSKELLSELAKLSTMKKKTV